MKCQPALGEKIRKCNTQQEQFTTEIINKFRKYI